VINSILSGIRRKKFGELWSTNNGDLVVQSYPKMDFFKTPYFGP